MNKSSKPILLYLIILLITVFGIVLSIVISKISYEQMLMKKDKTEKELIVAGQEQKRLKVTHQDLLEEERIIPFAEKNLLLIRNFDSDGQIKISKEKIENLEEIIRTKYE